MIPLYKGKNTCPLDVNNYRGITLLTCMNKMFEILLWGRVKNWWHANDIISPWQGACKKGFSCLHSAMILQESVSVGLGTNKKVLCHILTQLKHLIVSGPTDFSISCMKQDLVEKFGDFYINLMRTLNAKSD